MNKGIIPLTITILLILISIGMVIFRDYLLDQTHYIGITGILFSLLFYFSWKNIYVVVFGLTLIGGIFGLLDVFYVNMAIEFGVLKFNPIFLILMILFFAFNRETMDKMFPEKRK